jgi:hypothetical protein
MLNFNWWVNRKDPEGRNVFAGGFLGFRARDRVRWARPAALVAILGVVLAVSASAAFAADYSGALSKDVGASPSFQSGPWTSFTGTNSSSPFANESQSYAWGPAIGWYLPFGAIAWVGAGAFLLLRYGKGLPSTPVEGAGPPELRITRVIRRSLEERVRARPGGSIAVYLFRYPRNA